jgi:hypothetical protein
MRVEIICHGCKELKFIWMIELKRPNWSGLCHECINTHPPYNKLVGKKTLNSGSVIYWDVLSKDGKRVRVLCGACEEEWWPLRTHAVSRNRNQKWTGFCPTCLRNPDTLSQRLLERMRQAGSGDSNEQGNGNGEKRRPGRPPEDRTAEHEQLKLRFESIVIKLSQQLPPHKIKRPAIAAEYASRGEPIDQSTITKRVQLLYGEDISVADAVALVLSKNRENNAGH